jgi:hypothetical protein
VVVVVVHFRTVGCSLSNILRNAFSGIGNLNFADETFRTSIDPAVIAQESKCESRRKRRIRIPSRFSILRMQTGSCTIKHTGLLKRLFQATFCYTALCTTRCRYFLPGATKLPPGLGATNLLLHLHLHRTPSQIFTRSNNSFLNKF